MIRLLFVCLGNICRSPLAQGIFENKIKQLGLVNHLYADSAGTSGYHKGEKPDPGSLNIARQKNINIENQRSRPVSFGDRQEFDYFIAMDEMNLASLVNEFGIPKEKVFKIRDFDSQPENGNVPDPYGGGSENFSKVYEILDRSMDALIVFLKKKHNL
jgi:protein-tyrosine-phosphatase